MDAKDFIFPGVILALVIIVGIGLLLTHSDRPTLVNTTATSTATSTMATSSPAASTSTPAGPAPASPGTSVHPYGSVTLALGQAAVFADGTSIRPMHILEDSRCPMGVMCIQAGTVKLSFNVVQNGRMVTQSLTIGKSVKIGSDTITLDSVEPQKMKGGYPEASAYRFTFTVQHG